MKIVYYTSGTTGWGRVVTGISIYNALKRNGIACEYAIISSSDSSFQISGLNHIKIPVEDETTLLKSYQTSILYKTLAGLKPDVILFDLIWYATYNFIDKLNCKKIFLCRQVSDKFFSIDFPEQKLVFDPDQFDLLIATEPFKTIVKMDSINPIVFRNRDEILAKEDARNKLNLDKNRPACLFSFNAKTGNFDEYLKKYSHLEDFYQMVYTHKSRDGLFPESGLLQCVRLYCMWRRLQPVLAGDLF